MRRTRTHGRPCTPVIPPEWAPSHAPVLDGTRDAVVSLIAPSAGAAVFDEATGRTTVTDAAPYAKKIGARIQSWTFNSAEAGEELVRVSGFLVTINLDHTPAKGDLVKVIEADGDALLVGATLRIADVTQGSDRAERHLFATLDKLAAVVRS